jgi:hypothetical protein
LALPSPPPLFLQPSSSLLSRCDDKKGQEGVCDATFLF